MTISPATLLVVEDSDEDFDTVLEALDRTTLANPIQRAATGDECLALLRGAYRAGGLRPALVLLDRNTPGMDGRDALAAIRADRHSAALPVIVMEYWLARVELPNRAGIPH